MTFIEMNPSYGEFLIGFLLTLMCLLAFFACTYTILLLIKNIIDFFKDLKNKNY